MAERIDAYRADDGSIHPTECAAVKHELGLLIEQSPIAENKPFARIAHKWLTENAHKIGAILMHYGDVCPNPAEESSAEESLERTREEGPLNQHQLADFGQGGAMPDELGGDCS